MPRDKLEIPINQNRPAGHKEREKDMNTAIERVVENKEAKRIAQIRDAEEKRIALEAIEYLEDHTLSMAVRFPEDSPPSQDVAWFLIDYFADVETDLAFDIRERIETYYPQYEN